MIIAVGLYFIIAGIAECHIDPPRNAPLAALCFGLGWLMIPARILKKLAS